MNAKKLLLILTLYCMKVFNAFCFNKFPKTAKESDFAHLTKNNEKLEEIINGKEIYPLVSLEIKTQQLKLEGEVIPSKIVSRSILVAKGMVESRLSPNDLLYFTTNIIINQVVKVKQLVGAVTYSKINKEELLYSSCDGVIKEVLPQGSYSFEVTFFIIYCDLKKSAMGSYFGYSVLPSKRNEVFSQLEYSSVKKEVIAKRNILNDYNTFLISNKECNELDSKQCMQSRCNENFGYHDTKSEYYTDKSKLNFIYVNTNDSLTSGDQKSPNSAKRVEFLYKRSTPNKSELSDSSLTMKLKAYRKSLETLKQSVANITDFPRTGSAKVENDKQLAFGEQMAKASKVANLSAESEMWILITFTILILILLVVWDT